MKTSIHQGITVLHHRFGRGALLLGLLLLALQAAAQVPGNTDQALQLMAGEHSFAAILKPANSPEPRGMVILLHGEDQHMDFPAVVSSLRHQLADDGWHTLSLQMPNPASEKGQINYPAYLDQAMLRIQAALDYLDEQHEVDRIYIVGHGLGGAAGLAFLTQEQGVSPLIKAFAGISLGHFQAETTDPRLNISQAIEKLTLPMLDIYAQGDRMEANYFAKDRHNAARRNDKIQYRQLMLPAQSHQFYNFEALLSKRIYGWLVSIERLLDIEEKEQEKARATESTMEMPPRMADDEAPATMEEPLAPAMEEQTPETAAEENGSATEDNSSPEPPPPAPASEGNPEVRENLF